MRSDVLRHWRDPRFWQWWWREAARGETKATLVTVAGLAVLLTGFLGAQLLAPEDRPTAIRTERVVTIVRVPHGTRATEEGRATVVPQVSTARETVTQPSQTDLVTVRRRGRTVVVRRPAERVVVPGPGNMVTRAVVVPGLDRVVTDTRTDTVVSTATADRLVTVTAPAATDTVTRNVTGPTVTETQVETVTQPVTVTQEVTVTDLITVTVTLPLATGG